MGLHGAFSGGILHRVLRRAFIRSFRVLPVLKILQDRSGPSRVVPVLAGPSESLRRHGFCRIPYRNAPPLALQDEKGKSADKDDKDKDDEEDDQKKPDQPAILEDWWLVRDQQKRVGWIYGHTVYLDVPDEIAQYSEGQRMVAAFPLDQVQDQDKQVSEYLVLFTDNKDGMPYDFNQVRVFTWNSRKHRYETAYRERELTGVLPVTLGQQDFEREGKLRTFTLNLKTAEGSVRQQLYKFNPPIVRKVYAAGEEPPSKSHRKKAEATPRRHGRQS